ncbi:hypothetical protein D3C87_1266290 [compost metagenome]
MVYFNVSGIFTQARALAVRTNGFPPVPGQHNPVLDFIGLLFQFFKKLVEPTKIFIACPQQFLLFFCQLTIGTMDREIKLIGISNQVIQPFAHLLPPPRGDGIVVYTFAFIRNNQIFINTDDTSVAFAPFTGTIRVVKAKEIRRWLFKADAVQFKPVAEMAELIFMFYIAIAFPFKKSSLHRIRNTA